MLLVAALAWGFDPADTVAKVVAGRLSVPLSDVEVTELVLPATVPANTTWQAELPNVGPVWGHVPVVLRGVAGQQVLRFVVRPVIRVWKELPAAAEDTSAGERIVVKLRRVALDTLRGGAPVDADQDWRARVDLPRDAPLTSACVEPMPAAVEGAMVRLMSGSEGLVVIAPGRLDQDAFLGATVRVTNLSTKSQIDGVYQADGIVRVGGGW